MGKQVKVVRIQGKPVPKESSAHEQRERKRKGRQDDHAEKRAQIGEKGVSWFLWALEATLTSNSFPICRPSLDGPGLASFPCLEFQNNFHSVQRLSLFR